MRESVLDDTTLQIMASDTFLSADGVYWDLGNPTKHLVYLNTLIVKTAEKHILLTIAHELAHWIAGKGETGLYEKEAEDLLMKWGFEEEAQYVRYHQPILESGGYRIGYEWAKKQDEKDLLYRFEKYYDDWNADGLSAERLETLVYNADPSSIFDTMCCFEEEGGLNGEESEEDMIIDDGSMDKGIVWGIMAVVKEILLKRQSNAHIDESEVVETLQKIGNEFCRNLLQKRTRLEKQ